MSSDCPIRQQDGSARSCIGTRGGFALPGETVHGLPVEVDACLIRRAEHCGLPPALPMLKKGGPACTPMSERLIHRVDE